MWPRGKAGRRKVWKKDELDAANAEQKRLEEKKSPLSNNSIFITELRDKVLRLSRQQYQRTRRQMWIDSRGKDVETGRIRERAEDSFVDVWNTTPLRTAVKREYGTHVMHDFCYGGTFAIILLAIGLFGLANGFGGSAFPVVHGIIHAATNAASFAFWTKGREHRPFTSMSFAHATFIFVVTAKLVSHGIAIAQPWSVTPHMYTIFAASFWAALFHFKSIVRGGNPAAKDIAFREWGTSPYGVPYT